MMVVSYDISDDKLRSKLAKFLSKHGYRLQYSMFCIRNSHRILSLVKVEIETKFASKFCETDSVLIYEITDEKGMLRYGYAAHDETALLLI